MNKQQLQRIIDDDDLGLLRIKPLNKVLTADDRLLQSFGEINEFVRSNGHPPRDNQLDVNEFKLYSRLQAIRSDNSRVEALLKHDQHNLLNVTQINSVNDVFQDDELGLLSDSAASIFQIKHVPKTKATPDFIAKRTKCKEFSKFEKIFESCQADLRNNKRLLLPFAKEKQISRGQFFVLKGVLAYIADVKPDLKNKRSPRLRVIFENGTEANLLGHSLGAALYKDGRRVSEEEEKLLDGFQNVTSEDTDTGYIYILKSRSANENIRTMSDLYKVGYSTGSVEDRIKGANVDPTFLMADVEVVAKFRCYNLNPQKLELLLHKFFGTACLEIDIKDNKGKIFRPREWFVAPLSVIEQAIHFIFTGDIVKYKYDPETKQIIGR